MRTWGSTTVAFLVNQVKSSSASSTRSVANLSRKKAWASPVGRALSASQRATACSAGAWAGAWVYSKASRWSLSPLSRPVLVTLAEPESTGWGSAGMPATPSWLSSRPARARARALVAYTYPRLTERTGKATSWASPRLTAPACRVPDCDSGPNRRSSKRSPVAPSLQPGRAWKRWRMAPLRPEPGNSGCSVWRSRAMGLSMRPKAWPAPMWTGLVAYRKRAAWAWNMAGVLE